MRKNHLNKKISNFDIFFLTTNNALFVQSGFMRYSYRLPTRTFLSLKCLKLGAVNLTFLNQRSFFWGLFWKFLFLNKHLSLGYYTELDLLGLGYKIKKINDYLFRFFWGYATFLYFFVPKGVVVQCSFEPKRIIVFGVSPDRVNSVASYFLLLKPISKYRLLGITKPGKIIRLRAGKQR